MIFFEALSDVRQDRDPLSSLRRQKYESSQACIPIDHLTTFGYVSLCARVDG